MQNALNPEDRFKSEKRANGAIYRVGDRIMQIKNNYDITWEKANPFRDEGIEYGTGVFNGEIGTVTDIDETEKSVTIKFDDEKTAVYSYTELEQIEHSYAITIHKAQRK